MIGSLSASQLAALQAFGHCAFIPVQNVLASKQIAKVTEALHHVPQSPRDIKKILSADRKVSPQL